VPADANGRTCERQSAPLSAMRRPVRTAGSRHGGE